MFSKRVHAVLMSAQGQPIKKRYVKEYLRSISKIFVFVGANDPHYNRMGELDFWLGRQLASYQREDSTPRGARPLPVSIIQALDIADQGTTATDIAISDLTWVAFFFLLFPGE